MRRLATLAIILLAIGSFAAVAQTAQRADILGMFPTSIAGATLDGQPKAYDSKTIIDYMDATHAQAYFRFAFHQLYAATYKLGDKQARVEVFDMTTGPEAYGIYSMDLDGPKLKIGQGAHYSAGTLRCWQDHYFIQIRLTYVTPKLKGFATAIAGKLVKAIGGKGEMPPLCGAIPPSLHPTNFCFFHEFDANAVQYFSPDNVLELDKSTSMIVADCTLGSDKVSVAVVQYPSAALRDKARTHFEKVVFGNGAIAWGIGASTEEVRKGSFTGIIGFDFAPHAPMLAICFNAGSHSVCGQALFRIAYNR